MNIARHKAFTVCFLLITLILFSCDKLSGPADREVEQQVSELYANLSIRDPIVGWTKVLKEYMTLKNVRVVDRMVDGNKAVVIARVTIEYNDDYDDGSYMSKIFSDYTGGGGAVKGEKKTFQRRFYFSKFDSGWRLNTD